MISDFKDLLSILNASKARYLIVGGYAVMKYTEPRYTKDLDIWVEASPKNSLAVFAALVHFGAPLKNLSAADFSREGSIYQMGRPPARVDILTSIGGVRFAHAWKNRVPGDFDGISSHVISRQDLLANKQAVGRPQDLLDVHNLLQSERDMELETRDEKSKKASRKKGRGPE